jgi:hypothetical protein
MTRVGLRRGVGCSSGLTTAETCGADARMKAELDREREAVLDLLISRRFSRNRVGKSVE